MPAAARVDLDRMRTVLSAAGYAWTRPRSAVLHVFLSAPTPLTVEELHDRLGRWAAGRRVNLSSVYRTVKLLQDLRVLRRVALGDAARRFELAEDFRDHHHHFVCEACGRIEDVRRCPLEGADLGRGVRFHHLELFGLCRGCTPEPARGVRSPGRLTAPPGLPTSRGAYW
jgi:Fe2+ or Zn2+ uptake regulation protein